MIQAPRMFRGFQAGCRDDRSGGLLRSGFMGGTFDPIHDDHLAKARAVAVRLGLDEVVFVPAGRPWHKDGQQVTAAEHRYAMTAIAAFASPIFRVSRIEIDRPGPTYTVDTLRELRRVRGSGAEIFFIVGADALATLPTWRDADELVTLAHFVGCSREGFELADPGLPNGRLSLVTVPARAISSTLIRQRVRAGRPIRRLVPAGVDRYIREHRLYRAHRAARAPHRTGARG